LVEKAEHHDGAVARVGGKGTHAASKTLDFTVGVEQCDVDPPPWAAPDVELDDTDLRFTAFEQGSQAFEDDLVVVHEGDLDRLWHAFILNSRPERGITRSGD
jgi:hypothetical protein